MPTGRFPVNMSGKARYVTQASAYDRLLEKGPLTDAAITRYIKAGYYGRAAQARLEQRQRLARKAAASARRTREPKLTVDQLLAKYGI